jgi:hypothetical protein
MVPFNRNSMLQINAMAEAFRSYPLAVYLHMADMEATYLVESKGG